MFVLFFACASEYGLSAWSDPTVGLVPTDDLGDGAAYAAWTVPVATEAVPATPTTDDDDGTPRVEDFALGATPTSVADYLFVLDESISMRHVMAHVRRGFASLRRSGAFPDDARIAVLYTTPADPADRTQPYPADRRVGADTLVPGFQALVDGPRIAAYVAAAPATYADRYWRPGCTAWFSPRQKNADGDSCLAAAFQEPLLPGRFEAGLVALRQWLEATDGTPRFRSGAAVNVIFVSDTHDPGADRNQADPAVVADLDAQRPDFAELRALVDEPVSAFRVHAIAPKSHCGEAWSDATYFDVVAESGGVEADVCTVDDYRPVLDEIGLSGSVRENPVLRLGYRATTIGSVTIDGASVPWSLTGDGQSVVLDGELPTSVHTVRIAYRAAS